MTPAKRIFNVTQDKAVCAQAMLADRPWARMRGLLGRQELPVGEGLLLTPAPSVHTAFMRFAIDAVFLDRELKVLKVVERMKPWRAAFRRRARSVLELPAGQAAATGLREGDQLRLEQIQLTAARIHARPPLAVSASQTAAGGEGCDSMRVMVLSTDRRFREVTCLLLARRGCAVSTGVGSGTLTERIDRDGADVVVIDADRSLAGGARMAAAIEAHSRPVGIVLVRDQPESTLQQLPTIRKWGSFETLFAAIQEACAEREHRHAPYGLGHTGAAS